MSWGCVNGGGQLHVDSQVKLYRCQELNEQKGYIPWIECSNSWAHENPVIIKMYDDYLEFQEAKASLLHTSYVNRGVNKSRLTNY